MRILFGHAPQTALQPEVLQGGGGAVVHAAAWWGSVMPCAGNMRPCCGGQVFPGARSDASLWGACCAWNSGVAIIIWGSHNNDKNQCQPGAHKSWDWHLLNMKWRKFAGTTLLRLTGSGGNWWRQSQSEVVKWVSVLRPTQRRAPNSHCRPPTSPCKSLI